MRIGVDVDGVLTDLENYQLKNGKKYFKNVEDINEAGNNICEIFNCTKEESEAFWKKYIWKYSLSENVRPGMKELLSKAASEGDEIFIITSRAHTTEAGAVGDLFRKMLNYWLKSNDIPYEKIYYCDENNSSSEKYDVCRRLGIDVMIEDDKENIKEVKKTAGVLCIANKNNASMLNDDRVLRMENVSEKDYDKLVHLSEKASKDKMNSNYVKKFDKDAYRFNYGVVRGIGAPLFKLLLKPTIINKEYIPKTGSVILCGNHLHVWDQFPVICSTKRPSHWMSKKEYFDSKMGPFFEKTGAICVDRKGDAHQAEFTALNYLDIDSAVGLFPEGTRNHLKQEHIDDLYKMSDLGVSKEDFVQLIKKQNALLSQVLVLQDLYKDNKITVEDFNCALTDINRFLKNYLPEEEYYDSLLLPFKFGAVSMAQHSGALIVPFGVTGDYTIGNDNLTVSFDEGFIVRPDDSLEEANTKLRSKILKLVRNNLEK